MNRIMIFALILAGLWGAGLGCGDDSSGDDVGVDDGAVETTEGGADGDGDIDVAPETDVEEEVETTTDVDVTPEAEVVEEAETTADADVEEEAETTTDTGPAVCGNGVVEAPEVCDDGNTDNEACRTPGCLADCTLLMDDCGNGTVDPGEACDDGNTDSYDSCTSSCTVNDQNVGAPCRCTAGCDDTDPTAGTIVGCENVVIPAGTGGVLACGRSVHIAFPAMDIYSVEGSCTVMALNCTGSGMVCGMAPVVGDVDTFACPTGYNETTDVRTVMGATLTTKVCGKPCDGENDCRWNAYDASPPTGGDHTNCGQWQCIEDADTGLFSCGDARM
jgi:cysteine-rich repeat protein